MSNNLPPKRPLWFAADDAAVLLDVTLRREASPNILVSPVRSPFARRGRLNTVRQPLTDLPDSFLPVRKGDGTTSPSSLPRVVFPVKRRRASFTSSEYLDI
jgi:hypothetical protein